MILHLTVEKVLAFGILVWLWNRLGLSDRATLVGNIVAMILLIVFVFVW